MAYGLWHMSYGICHKAWARPKSDGQLTDTNQLPSVVHPAASISVLSCSGTERVEKLRSEVGSKMKLSSEVGILRKIEKMIRFDPSERDT